MMSLLLRSPSSSSSSSSRQLFTHPIPHSSQWIASSRRFCQQRFLPSATAAAPCSYNTPLGDADRILAERKRRYNIKAQRNGPHFCRQLHINTQPLVFSSMCLESRAHVAFTTGGNRRHLSNFSDPPTKHLPDNASSCIEKELPSPSTSNHILATSPKEDDSKLLDEMIDATVSMDLTSSPIVSSDAVTTAAAASTSAISELSWYNPGLHVMNLVHFIHDVTGFSYAGSIAFATVGIRLLMIPLAIKSRENANASDCIQSELDQFQKKNKGKFASLTQSDILALRRKYKFSQTFSFALPVASLTSFVTMWYGLRWFGYYYPQEMLDGGVLWFTDLSKPDPIRYLPILSGLTFIIMGEFGADHLGRPTAEETSVKKVWFWRAVRVSFACLVVNVPAAVFCHWVPNNLMSIGQTYLLAQPGVLNYLGIVPPLASSSDQHGKTNEGGKPDMVMYQNTASGTAKEEQDETKSEVDSSSTLDGDDPRVLDRIKKKVKSKGSVKNKKQIKRQTKHKNKR
uniref:Membrane insertase YidC/Oxa/ALB C-terminal domain-containing protein n=1 Tax=Helicotheca tamesis TaxID=374047 RepID=A0A7S2HPJ1_9STRA